MSEFLITGDNSVVVAEHLTKRIIAGDAEGITERLAKALEHLGYVVLASDPIIAKRAADRNRVGKVYNVPARLTVALRPASGRLFTANFEYQFAYAGFYKGDLTTIEREVDAILALAYQNPDTGNCSVCGTSDSADSRFCRVCGSPSAGRGPAELEVLRLNAEIRTGHRAVIGGVSTMAVVTAVAASFILWGNPKGVNIGWGLLAIGQAISWLTLLYGIYITHVALNPRQKVLAEPPAAALIAENPSGHRELTSPAVFTSVTENTTRSLSLTESKSTEEPRRITFDTLEN